MLDANAILHTWITPFADTSNAGCVRRSAGTAKVSKGVRIRALQRSCRQYSLIPRFFATRWAALGWSRQVVLAGPRPRLRLVANDLIVEDVIRLIYVPA